MIYAKVHFLSLKQWKNINKTESLSYVPQIGRVLAKEKEKKGAYDNNTRIVSIKYSWLCDFQF